MDTEGGDQKNAKIGDGFDHGPTTNSAMAKRRPWLDSAHQLGLSTLSTGILIVVGGHRRGNQKNAKIGDNFDHGPTTNGSMAKRRPQLDSAHPIGLSTLCTGILIVVDVHRRGDQKNAKVGDAFDHGPTTSCSMAKWRLQLDSAHQLGLSTLCTGILIVVD